MDIICIFEADKPTFALLYLFELETVLILKGDYGSFRLNSCLKPPLLVVGGNLKTQKTKKNKPPF